MISEIVRQTVEPLCEKTAAFLRPFPKQPTDYLSIGLADHGFRLDPYAIVAGQRIEASHGARVWMKDAPGRKQVGLHWELPATDTTCLLIDANFGNRITFQTPEAEQLYRFLVLRFLAGTTAAKIRAQFFIDGSVPPDPEDFVDHPEFPLNPYQKVAHHTVLGTDGSGLHMEQGTGKTPVSIARIMTEARRKKRKGDGMYRALICCPKSLRINWERELQKFATLPGKIVVVRGGKIKRMHHLMDALRPEDDCDWSVAIASYGAVAGSTEEFSAMPWDIIIPDESHNFKGPETKRTKCMMKIRDAGERRMNLTGTPICNRVFDLFTQLEFMGEGLSGMPNFKVFREFYGRFEGKHNTLTGYENLPLLQERLARLCFTITKAQALPFLPSKMYSLREVSMTHKQAELYVNLQEQIRVEIERMDTGLNKSVTANNILTMLLRLAQITSGFVAWDAEMDEEGNVKSKREIEYFSTAKSDVMMEIINEMPPTSKAIIWACFIPDIKHIQERLKDIRHVTYYGATSEKDRIEAERAFNQDPDCRVFIGNQSACREGLNLRGYDPDKDAGTNCDTVIYYSQDWSMPKRKQSEDRCHRIGTRVPVQYWDLVVPNSVDEEIRKRVTQKAATAATIQDVSAIMATLLNTNVEEDDE